MAEALAIGATVISTVGTLAGAEASAQSAIYEGKAYKKMQDFQAQQLNRQAGQERAVSQLQAIEERRKGRLAQSRALALAAASGGGTDGSVQKILADLGAQGEFNAQSALYEGEESAKGLETQAAASKAQGKFAVSTARSQARATRRSSYISAVGNLLSSGASMYDKYWPEQEPTTKTPKFIGGIGGTGAHYQYG